MQRTEIHRKILKLIKDRKLQSTQSEAKEWIEATKHENDKKVVAIADQMAYIPDDSFFGPGRWRETM